MIQLASESNAGPKAWQAAPAEGKGADIDARRPRHAWPFISRQGEKPAAQEHPKDTHGDSGS